MHLRSSREEVENRELANLKGTNARNQIRKTKNRKVARTTKAAEKPGRAVIPQAAKFHCFNSLKLFTVQTISSSRKEPAGRMKISFPENFGEFAISKFNPDDRASRCLPFVNSGSRGNKTNLKNHFH